MMAMTLPQCESVGIESIRGIQFAIDKGGRTLVAHCWVGDQASGIVFGAVEDGQSWDELRRNVHDLLDDITEYCQDESGLEPRLVGLGAEYDNPPKRDGAWMSQP